MELYFKTRADWRSWLEENYQKTDGIWFVFYKKLSGKPSVAYNDAVEEALCFGWIDGKIKRVNEDYYIQWFTPRRPRSKWSELNISRVNKLLAEDKMRPSGIRAYENAEKRPESFYSQMEDDNLQIPEDLIAALTSNPVANDNFMKFSPSCRKLYLLWLSDAKRQETRLARIAKIVDRSEKNIKAGMM
jgi:uncharacterized protein YdeI (YjbR/CyaY-like superfamily)